MNRQPPRATRTDTRVPHTTIFRSVPRHRGGGQRRRPAFAHPHRLDPGREDDGGRRAVAARDAISARAATRSQGRAHRTAPGAARAAHSPPERPAPRSEEHTSELQSLMRISYAVFCLKKKKTIY